VIQACHNLLSAGRFPVAVLMIEVAPQEVDVNVHPTKAEFRFRNSKAVFSAVQRAVREAIIAGVDPLRRGNPGLERGHLSWGGAEQRSQMGLVLEIEQTANFLSHSSEEQDYQSLTDVPVGPQPPLKPRTLPMLRVVGQVGGRYIVAEGPVGLYLIDQCAADSRTQYEDLLEQLEGSGQIQPVEIPAMTIDLTRNERLVIEPWLSALEQMGIGVEPFGPNTFIIRSMPEVLSKREPGDVFGILITDLLAQPHLDSEEAFIDLMLKRLSVLAAAKTGQVLSLDQMQRIIRQLERSQNPHEDPYGRPTLIHMSAEQLAREFGN
jgi:DNA mismatch repair protein MutL